MSLTSEVEDRVDQLGSDKDTIADILTSEGIGLCDGGWQALLDEFGPINDTISSLNNLRDVGNTWVNLVMSTLDVSYLSSCGAKNMVDATDAYGSKLLGVQTIADGYFTSAADASLNSITSRAANMASPVERNIDELYPLDILSFESHLGAGGNLVFTIEVEVLVEILPPRIPPRYEHFPSGITCDITAGGHTEVIPIVAVGSTTATFSASFPPPDQFPTGESDVLITMYHDAVWVAKATAPNYPFNDVRDGIPGEVVSFFNPLSPNCAGQLSNIMNYINGDANSATTTTNTKTGDINNLIDKTDNLSTLEEIMTKSLGCLVGLLHCGSGLYTSVSDLAPGILAKNSDIDKSVEAIEYAKTITDDPIEIPEVAKAKSVLLNDYEAQVDNVTEEINTALDDLRSVF